MLWTLAHWRANKTGATRKAAEQQRKSAYDAGQFAWQNGATEELEREAERAGEQQGDAIRAVLELPERCSRSYGSASRILGGRKDTTNRVGLLQNAERILRLGLQLEWRLQRRANMSPVLVSRRHCEAKARTQGQLAS